MVDNNFKKELDEIVKIILTGNEDIVRSLASSLQEL